MSNVSMVRDRAGLVVPAMAFEGISDRMKQFRAMPVSQADREDRSGRANPA
jgi:hypothetical protein